MRAQGEEASANVEAASRYPEDLGKITNKGGYTKRIFDADKQSSIGKRGHLGLS